MKHKAVFNNGIRLALGLAILAIAFVNIDSNPKYSSPDSLVYSNEEQCVADSTFDHIIILGKASSMDKPTKPRYHGIKAYSLKPKARRMNLICMGIEKSQISKTSIVAGSE